MICKAFSLWAGFDINGKATVQNNGNPYTVEDMIVDVADLETRIESLRTKGRNIKRETLDYIDTLANPVYAEILERHYIDELSHSEIGKLLGHTTSTIGLYYRRAIAKLEDPPYVIG